MKNGVASKNKNDYLCNWNYANLIDDLKFWKVKCL